MRWDRLFDDLEGQLEQELELEEVDLVAEEERLRLGRLTLRDRLVAMAGLERPDREPVLLLLRDEVPLRLRISAAGRDWVAGESMGEAAARSSVVVPLAAISGLVPTDDQLAAGVRAEPAAEPTASLSARLGLTFVLRDLCRRRVAVDVTCRGVARHGTIDRVARDHLDLAEHEPGEPRRATAVRRVRVVPHTALDVVRY